MSVLYPYPGVYNVLDPWWDDSSIYTPMAPIVSSGSTPRDNALALLAIIAIAQAQNEQGGPYFGATIVFPGHSEATAQGGTGEDSGGIYYIQGLGDGSPTIPIVSNWPIKFLGTGSAKLVNYVGTDPDFVVGDFFSIQTNGDYGPDCVGLGDNSGGMTFENLKLEYPDALQLRI